MRRLSLRSRLFLSLFAILALGLVLSLLLVHVETNHLEKSVRQRLESDAAATVARLYEKIDSLRKENRFLAQLEIMDDIVAKDLDGRIGRLLRLKAEDIGLGVRFFVYDAEGGFVTLSSRGGEIPPKEVLMCHDAHALTSETLLFATPVYASFSPRERLGCLVMALPLTAMKSLLQTPPNGLAWFAPPSTGFKGFAVPEKNVLKKGYIYTLAPLRHPFNGWHIGYALDKEKALEPVVQMRNALLATFALMALLALLFVIWTDLQILRPIRELSRKVSRIATTRDYTQPLSVVSGEYETAKLQAAFNRLMEAVSTAINEIRRQSEEHARTLEELMRFIERIVGSETKESTLNVAIEELSLLAGGMKVYWRKDGETPPGTLPLRLLTATHDYGTLCIVTDGEKLPYRRRFFDTIAHIVALQIERLEALEVTKEALQSKTSFFSALSHELRTPLGSILSLTQYLMGQKRCDAPQKEALGRIESSADHLLQIINDILLLAKAEAGRLEPVLQPTDLTALVETTVETLRPLAEVKGLALVFERPAEILKIETDPKLLRQLLINLVANAIRYTDEGEVKVTLGREESNYVIAVQDTGRGIAKEHLSRVFEEFYRVDESSPGTGLGLAISRRIANALGGSLTLLSEPGAGTRAIVTLSAPRNRHP